MMFCLIFGFHWKIQFKDQENIIPELIDEFKIFYGKSEQNNKNDKLYFFNKFQQFVKDSNLSCKQSTNTFFKVF